MITPITLGYQVWFIWDHKCDQKCIFSEDHTENILHHLSNKLTCGGGVGGGVAINDAYKSSWTPSWSGGGNGSVAGLATSIES